MSINDHEDSREEDKLWKQLQNAVALAGKQDQIVWAIFGVFCAAEAVLLAALFQSGAAPMGFVGPIVSTAGVWISVVWFLIQQRALGWLRFHEHTVRSLEEKLQPPVALMPPEKMSEGMVEGESVRKPMVNCPRAAGILWLVTAIFWWVAKVSN